jgi:amino acid adenylation domain-containing protein
VAAQPASLADYVERSAAERPTALAVVDPSGRTITYDALDKRAEHIAAFLREQGVQPGDRVGLLLPKGIDAVSIMLGVLKARAAYVPADYSGPLDRARTILSDCAVRALFVHPRCVSVVPEDGEWRPVRIVVSDEEGDGADWARVLSTPPLPPLGGRSRDDLAYILYTSGSTGVPKGVMLTQENALSFVDWCSSVFHPEPQDQFSSHAPFHFDLSVLDIYVCLKHGATLHIISEELGKHPKELAKFIAARRLSMWYSTPSTLALLADFGDLPSLDCSALRVVLFAGEVFPVKHLRQIVRLWNQAAFYNLYGPTETNVCTFARIPPSIPDDRVTPYPIGWLCSHCEGVVLDEELNEVPRGGEGLLYIAGAPVFGGYWNRPVENGRAFLVRDGRRWYNTGDVVREDAEDGYIYVGRRDRMVKRRGYRIELGEIEKGLYQHPDVQEAAVVAVPDPASGVKIAAFIAPRPGRRPSIIDLKMFCGKQLLAYMNPDTFTFLDSLPMTSTNKVDYQSLGRKAQAGA